MKRKSAALVGASASALLGMAALVGGTYALFTDSATVTNHLKAGTLKISLVRTKLTKASIDSDGYIAETVDSIEKDFTGETGENVFGLEDGEFIVPCSSYTANMRIYNGLKENGSYVKSAVAFSYSVKIVLGEGSDQALSEQLEITVGQGTKEDTKKLSEIGSDAILTGDMKKTDESADFWVKAEFLDLEENNDAQGQKADFDLVVEAVQLTERN